MKGWRRLARAGALVVLLLYAAGTALACGRYGPPVRAEEYRQKDREKRAAEQKERQQTSPESRNEPLPRAP